MLGHFLAIWLGDQSAFGNEAVDQFRGGYIKCRVHDFRSVWYSTDTKWFGDFITTAFFDGDARSICQFQIESA